MRAAMRPAASQLSAGGATRALEEGATLIAAPQGKSTVVLQMPRGNLEGALS
jgi:elongator complex protein 1